MANVKYKIKIKGLKTPSGTIPMMALRVIADAILEGSERALRLSVEGASVKRGTVPKWLNKSLDFTITGIEKGSTVLEIDAPTMKEAAPKQIQQQRLWFNPPNPKDTAFTILSKSVNDAVSGKVDSERFDRGVLSAFQSFKPFLTKYAGSVEVVSASRPKDRFRMEEKALTQIESLIAKTPEPQAVLLTGFFNVIHYTGSRFQLLLEDNLTIPGALDSTHIRVERMRHLWGKKVTIKGTGHFNPSGKLRFIEAQVIKPFAEGEEVLQSVPEIQEPLSLIEGLSRKQAGKSPLKEVWGKWPGEESIDEILSALKESS